MNEDDNHLRLLEIFHYVVGGLAALFGLFPLIYVGMGIFMLVAPEQWNKGDAPPPAFLGWIISCMGVAIMAVAWVFAGAIAYAGRCLARRKRYMYCLVIAAIECVFTPFGTILGVFTLIVLQRPGVKQLFGKKEEVSATPSAGPEG